MSAEDFEALVAYIKAVAAYEAAENFNRNDCSDALRLDSLYKDLRDRLVR